MLLLEESSESGLFRDLFFGVRDIGNKSSMRGISCFKNPKFNLAFKNAAINSENVFCCLHSDQ